MRNRFISGMVTSGIIGATVGMYAYEKMNPNQRRMLVKRGSKIAKNASNLFNMIYAIRMLK